MIADPATSGARLFGFVVGLALILVVGGIASRILARKTGGGLFSLVPLIVAGLLVAGAGYSKVVALTTSKPKLVAATNGMSVNVTREPAHGVDLGEIDVAKFEANAAENVARQIKQSGGDASGIVAETKKYAVNGLTALQLTVRQSGKVSFWMLIARQGEEAVTVQCVSEFVGSFQYEGSECEKAVKATFGSVDLAVLLGNSNNG